MLSWSLKSNEDVSTCINEQRDESTVNNACSSNENIVINGLGGVVPMSISSSHVKSCEVYIEAGANEPAADVLECGKRKRHAVHNAWCLCLKVLLT